VLYTRNILLLYLYQQVRVASSSFSFILYIKHSLPLLALLLLLLYFNMGWDSKQDVCQCLFTIYQRPCILRMYVSLCVCVQPRVNVACCCVCEWVRLAQTNNQQHIKIAEQRHELCVFVCVFPFITITIFKQWASQWVRRGAECRRSFVLFAVSCARSFRTPNQTGKMDLPETQVTQF